MNVCVTVDLEQDCPPYLATWRGAETGAPLLLDLLKQEGVPATCFATGEFARRFPEVIRRLVAEGHELGCHGDTHASFREMTADSARDEIARASGTLRAFAAVTAFRAPFLQLPDRFLPLLAAAGYRIDSSVGRHKSWPARVERVGSLVRVPASVTSSTLRWPAFPRTLLFRQLSDPVVLFVHPWEFVDLRGERLRFDCRFKTGDAALGCLRQTIADFRRRRASFLALRALPYLDPVQL